MEDHTPDALANARPLRKEMSLPEALLWARLKGKPMGVKIRNQHPVDDYVLDFYCAAKRLAFEIDGIAQAMGDRPQRDTDRNAALAALGIEVVRIAASDVLKDVDEIAQAIVLHCIDKPPPSALRAATSPRGGGFSGAER